MANTIHSKTVPYIHGDVSIIASHSPEAFLLPHDSTQSDSFYFPNDMKFTSFVNQHQNGVSFETKLRNNTVTHFDWSGVIILLMFVMIMLSKLLYPRRFQQFLNASLSNKALNQLQREWNPLRNIHTYLFTFVYLVGFTMLIYRVLHFFGADINFMGHPLLSFLVMFAAIAFFIVGKYVTIIWLSVIFRVSGSGVRYLSNQIVFGLITSLILIPVLFVVIYNPSQEIVIVGISLFVAAQAMRLIRSLSVAFTQREFDLLYIFLYLCALEIVPLLILVKTLLIVSNSNSFG